MVASEVVEVESRVIKYILDLLSLCHLNNFSIGICSDSKLAIDRIQQKILLGFW